MSLIITGAAGFVGTLAAEYFKVQYPEDKIVCVDVRGDTCLDLTDKKAVLDLVREVKPSRILHLAGISSVGVSLKEPALTLETNITSFINILEAVRTENLPTKIILVSSSDVYGPSDNGNNPKLETDSLNPASPYAASKAALELIARQYAVHFGKKVIIARPFSHTGAGQSDTFVLPSIAKKLVSIKKKNGDPVIYTGNIEVERDFLDVKDVIRAYHLLFEKGRTGEIYNICSGGAVPIRWMLEEMVEMCGIKVEVRTDAGLTRKNDIPILVGSNTKLCNETGWQQTIPLQDTLRSLIDYWEDHAQ